MTGEIEVREIREVEWEPTPAGHDALVVPTAPLGARVTAWREHWDKTVLASNSPYPGGMGHDSIRMSSMQYLVEWTKLSDRTIRSICMVEYKWCSLGVADKLLTAMGEQHLLEQNPELHPRPNPEWSQDRWMRWKENQGCV